MSVVSRQPEFASYASIGEIAARADIHPSSVTRVTQAFGFEGWPAFRRSVRAVYIGSAVSADRARRAEPTSVAERSVAHDVDNVDALRDAHTQRDIEAIGHALAASPRTVVIGSGLAAAPAAVLGHLGLLGGLDVRVCVGSATTQAAQIAHLGPEDCVIAINVWRVTTVLYSLMQAAQDRGVTVCLLTDVAASRLSHMATHVVVTQTGSVGAVPSVTAMTAVAQAITLVAAGPEQLSRARSVERTWDSLGLMDQHE